MLNLFPKIDIKPIAKDISGYIELITEYMEKYYIDSSKASTGAGSSIRFSMAPRNGLYEEIENIKVKKTFVDRLRDYLKESGKKESEIYKTAQIDRKLFSKIMADREYKPSKDTCIALCVGMKLSTGKTIDMLDAAGYSLSYSIRRDVIIRYCFNEELYDIDTINEILYKFDEKTLGR